MVLIRTGYLSLWDHTFDQEQQDEYYSCSPGIGVSTLDWCHEFDISAVASDTIGVEVMQPEDSNARKYPVHCGSLVDLGLPLGEFWVLDELAADCAGGRRECGRTNGQKEDGVSSKTDMAKLKHGDLSD